MCIQGRAGEWSSYRCGACKSVIWASLTAFGTKVPLLLAVHAKYLEVHSGAEFTANNRKDCGFCFKLYPISWESNKARPACPDYSPLGIKFKFFDEHFRSFHMGIPARTPGDSFPIVQHSLSALKSTVSFFFFKFYTAK